jgi:DNA-binding FadR family transcriptional regulator
VAVAIATRISNRTLPEGEALPTELELAAQLGVTRSTVREALRELESEGLLARRRGSKRLVVTRPSSAQVAARVSNALALAEVTVHEVWEALTILEPPTAALAATQRSAADLLRIEAAVTAFAVATDTPAQLAAVAAFFEALDSATGNRALVAAQRPLLPLLESSLRLMIDRVPQGRARIALAQRRLYDAIARGDSDAARDWMAKHIRDFRRGFEVAGLRLSTRVRLGSTPSA